MRFFCGLALMLAGGLTVTALEVYRFFIHPEWTGPELLWASGMVVPWAVTAVAVGTLMAMSCPSSPQQQRFGAKPRGSSNAACPDRQSLGSHEAPEASDKAC